MSAWGKPRGPKWWAGAASLALILVSLFGFAAFSVGWDNPTIRLLGYVALVVWLFLLRTGVVLRRRAAGAQGERPGVSEAAKRLNREVRIVGIVLVLLGLFLSTAVHVTWVTRLFGLVVAMIGILLVKSIRRFDRLMRIFGIALVPLMVFSLASLYLDAVHGYHEAWAVYAFFAVALASALVWTYLVARAYGRWLSK
jgi:hypothetical protein